MERKERLSFESPSFEDQLGKVKDFANETRERLNALVEALESNNALPKAYAPPKYGPPKYPPIKTKEACDKAGGEWDEETKTCKFKKEVKEYALGLQGTGVLPSTNQGNLDAQAIALAEKIGRTIT